MLPVPPFPPAPARPSCLLLPSLAKHPVGANPDVSPIEAVKILQKTGNFKSGIIAQLFLLSLIVLMYTRHDRLNGYRA
jgi:hypothetical protein